MRPYVKPLGVSKQPKAYGHGRSETERNEEAIVDGVIGDNGECGGGEAGGGGGEEERVGTERVGDERREVRVTE